MKCRIITPAGIKFNGEVALVELKTSEGYLCLMNRHVPFVANILISTMYVKYPDGTKKAAAIGGGIVSSSTTDVSIVSESFDFVDDLDKAADVKTYESLERIREMDPENKKINVLLEIAANRIKNSRK